MIKELLLEYIVEQILVSCKKFLKEKRLKLKSSAKDIEAALSDHTSLINNWSNQISFNDLKKAKNTTDVFIDIDISLMPRKRRIDSDEQIEKIQCRELFKKIDQHCVVLVQPGAGKTTLMKFLCQSVLYDKKFYPDFFKFPILIRLRELNSFTGDSNVIITHLFDLCGLALEKEKSDTIINDSDLLLAKKKILLPLLDSLTPLLILDGFDELSTQKLKEKV